MKKLIFILLLLPLFANSQVMVNSFMSYPETETAFDGGVIVNGDFATPFTISSSSAEYGWTTYYPNSTYNASNDVLEMTKAVGEYCRVTARSVTESETILIAGTNYKLSYDVVENNSGALVRLWYNEAWSYEADTVGTHEVTWTQSASGKFIIRIYTDGALIKFDNISIIEQ